MNGARQQHDTNEEYLNAVSPLTSANTTDESLLNVTSAVDSINSIDKSYFILHVGPPKTATTTIQQELENFSKILKDKDRVLYFPTGRNQTKLIRTLSDSNCHAKLKRVREMHEQKNSTQKETIKALTKLTCWKPFLMENKKYRSKSNKHSNAAPLSFMYSAEGYGIGWARPTDWVSLRETLRYMNIELVVVITYRPYYEWLLSSKEHAEKWTGAKAQITEWPGKGGQVIKPFLPMALNMTSGKSFWFPFKYTDQMISMIAPHVPHTKLLNLHEEKSVLSSFLCDVLPNTPETCRYSLKKDAKQKNEFRANTRDHFRKERKGRMETITGYDQIAVEAFKQKLIDPNSIKRRMAGLKCRNFHQVVLNGTEADLPLSCPSREYLIYC